MGPCGRTPNDFSVSWTVPTSSFVVDTSANGGSVTLVVVKGDEALDAELGVGGSIMVGIE